MFAALSTFLTFVGFYALACYLYEQLRAPYRLIKVRWFTDEKERPALKERFGEWAAITGSSDGIGKEYAKELARQGINVVLIARNQEKLQAVVKEIESESKVQTKIVIADFTKGAEVYQHIEKELANLPIAILVNNVGIGNPGPIHKWTQESTQNIIETNIMAVSQLSRHFLQRMKAEKIKGAIVNVSSGTEHQPLPYGAYYAASKAYNRSFTLALQCEAAPYGILVQLLSPGFVVTKINSYSRAIMKGGLFIPPADAYARSAVNQLRDGVDETPGYLWHHVQTAVMLAVTWRIRRFSALKMFQFLK
ncbi:hydroxysteroid dehydrogenase-like protein 1 [Drosophila obscura]|uniref:hydroxysteroid dehydrogenase-like protein 1 n=1 Tax=Drosophila obscura TaxID=7282 RepID=UPI001BB269C6|nr:hydroxysteroid dehydrogenase-like protein 1 [Drosophila obscura]